MIAYTIQNYWEVAEWFEKRYYVNFLQNFRDIQMVIILKIQEDLEDASSNFFWFRLSWVNIEFQLISRLPDGWT